MRDDDKLLNVSGAAFGSGVIGVCDICGTRQAIIVLQKERFKLCVIDFLNKTWLKTEKKPGAPLPPYRSDRVWFETEATREHRAPAIVLVPTKVARHPSVLICPDLYGITTTVLDAAIRFAREGFEVLVPDLGKTVGVGMRHHASLRAGMYVRGGVPISAKPVQQLLELFTDALAFLRTRDMVDATKSAVFGTSFGASLALALASQDQKLAAVALAYPAPTNPDGLARLVTAPMLYVGGSSDRRGEKARAQLEQARASPGVVLESETYPSVRQDFLSRDLPAYDLVTAEKAWTRILAFLHQRLMPPLPKPPAPPVKVAPSTSSAAARPPLATAPRPAPPAAAGGAGSGAPS